MQGSSIGRGAMRGTLDQAHSKFNRSAIGKAVHPKCAALGMATERDTQQNCHPGTRGTRVSGPRATRRAAAYCPLPRFAHAPSLPGPETGGATGTRVPYRQPRSASALQETLAGRQGNLSPGSRASRPGGCLPAPASAILSPGARLWCPALTRHRTLSREGRSPAPRHCWRLAGNGCIRASRISSHSLSFRAPPVPHWTVNGPIHVPSQTTVTACCHSPEPRG